MKNKSLNIVKVCIKILGAILILIGLASVITAIVWQQILIFQKYGVLFGGDGFSIFIPHWSALLYLGIIPLFIGYLIIYIKR